MEHTVIAICREYGSGGRIIGKRLAEELGVSFYDRDIISLTAKQSGFTEEVVAREAQKKTSSLLYNLYMASRELPVTDQVFIAQSQVIRKVAQEGPCVIVGRCADYLLAKEPGCYRVYVHAPLEERVRRVRDDYKVEEKNPEAYVKKKDRDRSGYYTHFTQSKWGNPQHFHLCVDSSIGIEKTVRVIAQLVKEGNA